MWPESFADMILFVMTEVGFALSGSNRAISAHADRIERIGAVFAMYKQSVQVVHRIS